MWPERSRGYRRGGNVGLMLLLLQICQAGIDRIPPVTLGTIALNSAVFLGVVHPFFNQRYPHPMQVCAGVNQVWNNQDYWRIIEATFYHADDWHLYFNMISFLWKGMSLERAIGSRKFFSMVAVFSVLVNIVMLYLNYAAAFLFHDASYLSQCAVGFSGVVFAVKVVTTQMMPRGTTYIIGFIPVNTRISCWFELVVIQILVPNASFTGHLAGILVGLAYAKGPLRAIINWPFSGHTRSFSGPSYTYHHGTASNLERPSDRRFDEYTGGLTEEEQTRIATEESYRENQHHERLYPDLSAAQEGSSTPSAPPLESANQPPPYGWNIPNNSSPRTDFDENEVRRRRLERFSRSQR